MHIPLIPVHHQDDRPDDSNVIGPAPTCRPHFLFSDDPKQVAMEFVRNDPFLSICCLPDAEYTGYTRGQRVLSAIAGLGLLIFCVWISAFLGRGDPSSADRDEFYRKHTSPGFGRCCQWSLERADKTCSVSLTQDMLCPTCLPQTVSAGLMNPGPDLDPSSFSCHGAQWNGSCGFTLEQCQDFATFESTCTDVVTYGTDDHGMTICRCVRAGRGRLVEHRDDDKKCDFVASPTGQYAVYHRTCSCLGISAESDEEAGVVTDSHVNYVIPSDFPSKGKAGNFRWAHVQHFQNGHDGNTFVVFHEETCDYGIDGKGHSLNPHAKPSPTENDMCYTSADEWFGVWVYKFLGVKWMPLW